MERRTSLREGIERDYSHEDRLEVARRVTDICLQAHGEKIAAVGIYGSTAVKRDRAYSDLDMTILTYEDLGQHTKCYSLNGLCVNLDYQTIAESMASEATVPGSGGCWASFMVLYERDGAASRLREAYEALGEEDVRHEFAVRLGDHLNTYIGKVRNAMLAGDRSSLVLAALNLGVESCRALQLLNGHYTTGEAFLREETKVLRDRARRLGRAERGVG